MPTTRRVTINLTRTQALYLASLLRAVLDGDGKQPVINRVFLKIRGALAR
jgi:hypothetical protein